MDNKDMNIPEGLPEQEPKPVEPQEKEPEAVSPLVEEPKGSAPVHEAPQIPIEVAPSLESRIPNLHPVHKKRMVVLLFITMILGLVSVASLLFALKMKGDSNFTFNFGEEEPVEVVEVETEEEPTPMKKSGEFDPVDIVQDLDNLNLEDIEQSYLDSGLN